MPNIFDLCFNKKDLINLKSNLQKAQEQKAKENREKFIENYRKHYIFGSHEEALNWGIEHPDESVQWYSKILFWEKDKQKFKSYEQEFDLDGIIPFNVIKYYTKEELLTGIKEHIKYCNNKYPEEANTKWWLDEYGKLSYVNI